MSIIPQKIAVAVIWILLASAVVVSVAALAKAAAELYDAFTIIQNEGVKAGLKTIDAGDLSTAAGGVAALVGLSLAAVATLHNSSKVVVEVRSVTWGLSAVAPYPEQEIRNKLAHILNPETSEWILGWDQIYIATVPEYLIIEPGETNEVIFDFIIPNEFLSVLVNVFIPNNVYTETFGWDKSIYYDIPNPPNL